MPSPDPVAAWHALVAAPDRAALEALLAPEAVFRSPAVHTPQEGADRTAAYLWAALHVLGPTLTYDHAWRDDDSAVLRFTAEVDGRAVEGVDLLRWRDDGLLVEFTVMVRPLRGLEALVAAIGARLQADAAGTTS